MKALKSLRIVLNSTSSRLTILAVVFAVVSSGFAQSYTIVDIGTLGGTSSFATDINNAWQITGYSTTMEYSQVHSAFLWENGVMTNIGPLSKASNDILGIGINNLGVISGYGEDLDIQDKAFRWQNGHATELSSLGTARGYRINDLGDIVGRSSYRGLSPSHAVMWIEDEIIDLGLLYPPHSTHAFDINNYREVVGWGYVGQSGVRGFHWQNGIMTELPTLGGEDCQALRISDSGWIVGSASTLSEEMHPVVWIRKTSTAISIIDLGLPEEFDFGSSGAVNKVGVVVGSYSETLPGKEEYNKYPFVWEDNQMQLLEELIPANTGWDLRSAVAINDLGQIVGNGIAPNGEQHGYLLNPIIPGDLDGDLVVDYSDLILLFSAWGPCINCDTCPADLDNDCVVGTSDLLILLSNWF